MQLKRALVWTMLVALMLSLVPFGAFNQAQAATSLYFIPDNTTLRGTSNLKLKPQTDPNFISRTNTYVTTSNTLSVAGTFNGVQKDLPIIYTVDALLKTPVTPITSPTQWEYTPDDGRSLSRPVTISGTNRFAADIPLFPGFNRIIISGSQNGQTNFNEFYVLYDEVPYLSELTVTDSSGSGMPISLNQGASIVVNSSQIMLDGVAPNATSVSVGGNQAAVQGDGTFTAPSMILTPGENKLDIVISNSANTTTIQRKVYYFDPARPYTGLAVQTPTNGNQDLLKVPYSYAQPPVVTDNTYTPPQADLNVTMLVKNTKAFTVDTGVYGATYSAEVSLNSMAYNASKISIAPSTIIPGPDGVTPEYQLINFTIAGFPFKPAVTGATYDTNQPVLLNVKYDGTDYPIQSRFTYYANSTTIQKVSFIKEAPSTPTLLNADASTPLMPLDGSKITSPNFYVLVEADKNIETSTTPGGGVPELVMKLLPVQTVPLNVYYVGNYSPTDNKKKVYQITGFPTGNQKLSFTYNTAYPAAYTANVNYVSMDYITVDSISDGQTFTFNSKDFTAAAPFKIKLAGQFHGKDALTSHQFSANGSDLPSVTVSAYGAFDTDLSVGTELMVGQNTITITGMFETGGGSIEVVKEIKIYIVDNNIPVLQEFTPAKIPDPSTNRLQLPSYPTVQPAITEMLRATPDNFSFQTTKYVTQLKNYDLVIRFTGAERMVLKRGADEILNFDPLTIPTPPQPISGPTAGSTVGTTPIYSYEYAGNSDDFLIRIKDVAFTDAGSHVYSLELTNATGAKVIKRLEIERQASPLTIMSPVNNAGNKVVVTKNFVRFDVFAEGAAPGSVLVDGKPATQRADNPDRFIYDYYGLKPDKDTSIKVTIKGRTDTKTVTVYYSSDVNINSEYMEKIGTKHSVFGGKLLLNFPKGTVLKNVVTGTQDTTRYFPDNKLLFGIADPIDGVVGRKNDYGNIIGQNNDQRRIGLQSPIPIDTRLKGKFTNTADRRNFSTISSYYWVSGGLVSGDKVTDGVEPYSVEGSWFTSFGAERKLVPTQRGTLTLSFDKGVVTAAGTNVTVFRLDNNLTWTNIGGVVDTGKNTITVPFDEFGYYVVGKLKSSFLDVTAHPWARNVLEGLYSKGYMNNLNFNVFGADVQATRGEFTTLLVKAANLPLNYDSTPTFTDVGPNSRTATWDYGSIETAARAGIVNGLDGSYFGPNVRLTREQAATMIARALELKTAINDAKLNASLSKTFTDGAKVEYYAKPSVDAVVKAGIITGKPNPPTPGQTKSTVYFDPKANLTRAEAAQVAVRLLQKSTKVFPANLN